MSAKYTRITVTPDIGEALQVGAKAPFVVNLSQSISGVTIEELTKVSSEVKKDALSASNSAKAAKVSETNAKGSADIAKSQADLAKEQVVLATEQVEEAKNQVGLAKEQVVLATEQVVEAKNQVDLAKEQVGLATEQVVEAKNQVGLATEQVSKAKDQVGLAKDQVVLATEQAGIATDRALEATNQANLAKVSSDEATTQAALATTKADEAKASAESSSTSAMESKNSATESDNSAKLAEQNSQEAKVSADAAKVSETNAKGSADSAEASLNELKSHTYDKGTINSKLGDKVNKSGDVMTGALTTTTKVITKSANSENSVGFVSNNSGVSFIEYQKGSDYYTHKIPEKSGTLLLAGDFGLGSNVVYDGSTPSSQSPKDANDITSTGFYGGGGSSASNYFNNYYPILSMTRTGGDGTGYITQIQGSDGKLGFRHRVQNNWTDWYHPVILNHKGLQKLDGSIVAQNHRIGANPISVTRDGNDYLNLYPPKVGDGKDLGFFQYNLGNVWNGVLKIPRVPAGGTRELVVKEENNILVHGSQHWAGLRLYKASGEYAMLETNSSNNEILSLAYRDSTGSNVSVLRFPRQDGQVMVQGDYGFAGNGISEGLDESRLTSKVFNSKHSQIFRSSSNPGKFGTIYSPTLFLTTGDTWATIATSYLTGNVTVASSNRNKSNPINFNNLWGTSNTTTDSNGFIKKASPVITIIADGAFTTNDESEGATVTRVAQGEYLIEGVLGFNSDAGWGGADGGIEIPLDVNKQPLIWVDYKVMEDGSILIKTYHRTHPSAPKFARNDIAGYSDGDPIDIPNGRFISVRVQMPEQSIYNVRMRELEESSTLYEKYHKPIEEAWENKPEYINDAMDKFLNI
ncbi:tail fiber protein [Proteus phage PM135]|uniref:Tail fiber protein n=1 Tax=Proteus phage PM135 TaxID=2048008 RepID=A0A2H4PRH0_9CAUD|nr:tail fiber protein [Proteus phage PM135]ATW69904.1 tail fiber protein [Proteus phage PM135]